MLVLHFDYPSPASAVALLRLQALADEGGRVVFNGIDALGLDATLPPTLDQLEEHERYRERAAALGLRMAPPTCRPPTVAAHLVGDLAERQGLGAAWRAACLTAFWAEGIDLGDEAALGSLAARAGLDPAAVHRTLADRTARDRVRRRMIEQRGRGVGGVPVLELSGTLVSAEVSDADLRELVGL